MGSKRFLKAFFIVMFALLPVGLLNYLFIKNSGELFRAEEIVSKQSVTKQLYGSALSDYPYGYKLAIFEAKRPDVVVIGSSRALQMRENFFNTSFVNLGRTANYPEELEKLINDILKIHLPKVIILQIDFGGAIQLLRKH